MSRIRRFKGFKDHPIPSGGGIPLLTGQSQAFSCVPKTGTMGNRFRASVGFHDGLRYRLKPVTPKSGGCNGIKSSVRFASPDFRQSL
jgi:hypothetical protein